MCRSLTPRPPQIDRQQPPQQLLLPQLRGRHRLRPAVGGEDGAVEGGVEVGEPGRAGVVEVRQRAAAQLALGVLAGREQARGQRGQHVRLLAHQLRRVEPAPPRLVQRPRRLADGVALPSLLRRQRLVRRVERPREGERLERRRRRVARVVADAEPRPHPQRPELVRPRVQHAERVVVLPRDDDEL